MALGANRWMGPGNLRPANDRTTTASVSLPRAQLLSFARRDAQGSGGCSAMKKLIWVIGCLLLILPGTGHALRGDKALHHYVRASWSIQDGLPQISAVAIAQDKQGYIWVGTQSGLARFDGVRFRNFTPEQEPGLPGVWVRTLYLARDGRLWIGTYKGAAVRDGDRITALPAADAKRWPALEVQAFAEDAAGTLFVATDFGLFREQDGKLLPVPGAPEVTLSLLARPDGLLVGSRGAVHRLSAGRWSIESLPADAVEAGIGRLVQAHGALWAGTAMGLMVHGQGGWQRRDLGAQLGHAPVDMLYADRAGDLWAGGDIGLVRIGRNRIVNFVAPDGPGGIPGLRTAFEDREGSLWFGSQTEGIIRLRDSWTRRYSVAEGLHDRIVWSVAPDPDGKRIWVGTNNGVSLFDGQRFTKVVDGDALPHPNGYNLLAERDRLWIGTRLGLVLIEHLGDKAGQVQRPAVLEPIAGAQVNGVVRDADGTLWIPTATGLYHLVNGRLRHYGAAVGLVDPRVRYFYKSPAGRVLLGTQSGLFEMRGERFDPLGIERGLPPNLDVTSIVQLGNGDLVVGSLDEKTYLLHDGRWRALDAAAGLPANSVFFLTEHDGYLWAGGLRGITRVPLKDLVAFGARSVETVAGEMLLNERGDSKSGQQGYCCNGAGNAKGFLRGDSLWFPTRDGIVALDTQEIIKNPVPPNVIVERMQVQDQWRASSEASEASGIELASDSRDVSFEFTVLSFQDPRSVGVEYRLVGYDKAWRQGDPVQRNASYTNLPAGPYTFQVRGSNNAGVTSAQIAALPFSIEPRFQETPWFVALLALLVIAVVTAGYRLQQHRHRQQRQALELLVSQRTADLEIANRGLKEVSGTDPLTGLRNRRYITAQVPADLAYYDRRARDGEHAGEVMAFALVDLDHFKEVNDVHGHMAGDRVLTQVAHILRDLVRTGDYVVRWGGEEFLVVFRPMPVDYTAMIAERLCTRVSSHSFTLDSGQSLSLSCSVGMAEYPLSTHRQGPVAWERMVELADFALYHVKQNGRDGWVAFRPADRSDIAPLLEELQDDAATVFANPALRVFGNVGKLSPKAPPQAL